MVGVIGSTAGQFVPSRSPKNRIDPLRELKHAAERQYAHALASGMPREGAIFKHAAEQIIEHNNPLFFEAIARMKRIPVTIDEFVESKEFLAGVEYDIWPTLRDDLRRMNPDVMAGEPPITSAYLGGATGTGKSHLATGTTAYQGYCMTCFEQPQRLFGLTPMTMITFMLQSTSPTTTKRVLYDPFRKMFTGMEYVRKWVEWNKRKESVLELFDNIAFVPAAASLMAILGQAVAGAILDEVNFMQVILESKQVAGPQGLGGKFDQAEVISSNIERRRARSFTTDGPSFGCICTGSSTRYKGDFLDRKIDQMEEVVADAMQHAKDRGIPYVSNHVSFRHKQYEVNPKLIAAAKKYGHFKVLVGTEEYSTRIVADWEVEGEHYPANGRIELVPATPDYRAAFKKDPDAAIRDIIGIATDAISPYFRKRVKIAEAMLRGSDLGRWTAKDEYLLAEDGMPEWDEEEMPGRNIRRRPHWISIDLSRNRDKCGIGVVRLEGFENRVSATGVIEVLPKLAVVSAIGLIPDVMHEIDIGKVRQFVMELVGLGVNVKSIDFDGFDSRESIQVIRHAGIPADVRSTAAYETDYSDTRELLYDDRLDIQENSHGLALEMRTVEWYPERNSTRIDHPPKGTKDILDGVVGAVAGALSDREVRTQIESMKSSNTPVNNAENQDRRLRRPTRIRRVG